MASVSNASATLIKNGSKQQVGTANLDPHEWDFKDVPGDQLEACYLYEYAREFFKSSKHLQNIQKKWNNSANRLEAYETCRKALDLLRTRCENFPYINFDYFPKSTWQDLPDFPKGVPKVMRKNLRQSLADDVNDWSKRFRKSRFDRLSIGTLREFEPPNVHSLEHFQEMHEVMHREQDLGNTEYGFFAVNWDFKNSQIIESFTHWLSDQREARKAIGLREAKRTVSRGAFSDKLNWLGALRVKNYYPHKKDLVDYSDTNLKVDAPYSHYPDLLDAAKRATEEIKQLFPTQWSEKDFQRRQAEKERNRKKKHTLPNLEAIL